MHAHPNTNISYFVAIADNTTILDWWLENNGAINDISFLFMTVAEKGNINLLYWCLKHGLKLHKIDVYINHVREFCHDNVTNLFHLNENRLIA